MEVPLYCRIFSLAFKIISLPLILDHFIMCLGEDSFGLELWDNLLTP